MILFYDDWVNRHPGAIIDTQTKNESFLRISLLYREMGIKNHAFPLQLLNPELQGIDPFDPNLSLEQMAMIAIECKLNFFYFIREVARVPSMAGGMEQPFKANRGNIALYFLFFNHVTPILIQPRQTGKSFSTDELMQYLLNIRCTGTQVNLLTKDEKLRTENVKRVKDLMTELPFYLKQHMKGDISNTEKLTVKSLGNSYLTHLPSSSKKAALNVGRGLTSPIFHIDEGPFLHNIEISLPAALAAGTAAREIARINEEPYGTILTTTAGKKDDSDGKYIYNMLQRSAIWTERFFDAKDEKQLHALVRSSSPGEQLMVNCTFSHRQLGYTDEWLRRTLDETQSTGDAADRDFFNVWTSGSQLSPIPLKTLEAIRNSEREPLYVEISEPYNFVTFWYIPENQIQYRMQSSQFVLGLDTSDASGGDDITLILIDIFTGEIVAAGSYNETNLITFSEWFSTWFSRFENFTAIIERRSSGVMIIDHLLIILPNKGIDPFKRLFNRAVNDHDEDHDRYKEINANYKREEVYVKHKKTFGFATSASGVTSRNELYSVALNQATRVAKDSVYDKKLINQIMGLVTRNGRIDHEEGGHDDMVISWLLCFWFMFRAKNIIHYGVQSRSILSQNRTYLDRVKIDEEDYKEQQELRAHMETVYEKLINERNDFMQYKYERELRFLTTKLKLHDGEMFSIDELLEDAKRKRHLNRVIQNNNDYNYLR